MHPSRLSKARTSSSERAARLLQHWLELAATLKGAELTTSSDRGPGEDCVRDGGAAGQLSQYLLHLSVPAFAALVELDQGVINTGSLQSSLAVGRMWSVRLGEDQKTLLGAV